MEFVCCDNPHATKTLLQMLAVFAEFERDMISARTKAALAAAKARGTQLGNKNWKPALEAANKARNPNLPAPQVVEMMQRMRNEGKTLRYIATELNAIGLRTPPRPSCPKGSIWHACTVRAVLLTARKRHLAQVAA